MRADLEASAVERSNLVPRHPGMTDTAPLVPSWHHVGANHCETTKNVAGSDSFLEHGHRIVIIVAVAVIERDRQLSIRLEAALELLHDLPQRHHPKVPPEEHAVALEHADIDR
jgi:hypothetical protein